MTTVRKIAYPAGSHICALYNHPQEQLATAVEYIRAGLERGERCLYICGEISKDDFRKALIASGIDAEREEKRGALILSDKHSGYLPNGIFDPDGMITMLRRAVQDALDAGFSGLCGGGDMIWLLERAPGSDRLTEYEAQLNDFYRTHKARGLCFYNRSSLPAEVVDHSLATHKQVLLEGTVLLDNPYHEPDDRAMRRKAADPEIVAEKLDVLDATRIALQG
jgi:hypothetical protein